MSPATVEPRANLDAALAHAVHLLETRPALAIEQADEIIKVVGREPRALFVKAAALSRTGGGEAAIALLREALRRKADMPDAWRLLGDHLAAAGDSLAADSAYAQGVRYSTRDPRLMRAAAALCANDIPIAEALLREHLKQHPTDVAAMRMLAEVAARLTRYADAERLLARVLELAPSFTAARHNYAMVLHRGYKPVEALAQVDILERADPRNPGYRNLRAAILVRIGEYAQAIQIYADVLAHYPQQAKLWMSYGHALKTAGREPESIMAYERSIALAPAMGEAFWSLANLKTYRFSEAQLSQMRQQLASAALRDEDRFHFEFALGKALEDASRFEISFEHYARGNALRRAGIHYDAAETSANVQRCKQLFTAEFFAARAGQGLPASDPIFIVGLPRAGSTLIEQILSSHSLVEGTMELPDIPSIARRVGARGDGEEKAGYLASLTSLGPDALRALGEEYIAHTRIQRKTSAPFFIDKMPNNFAHVGLIHLILPQARIIDARRHPLGCCFSGFKQHFARGQNFSYDLGDIGRYYRDYVQLMAHFDAVLPGRVHRVIYEQLVDDTETQIRALADYCGLEFEAGMLRFYDNDRAVRTASSQQVRSPIFRDGLSQWQNYDKWLQPLKLALGSVIDTYPEPPLF